METPSDFIPFFRPREIFKYQYAVLKDNRRRKVIGMSAYQLLYIILGLRGPVNVEGSQTGVLLS